MIAGFAKANLPKRDLKTSYLEEEKMWNVVYIYHDNEDLQSNRQTVASILITAKTITEAIVIANKRCTELMETVLYEDEDQNEVIYMWDFYQIISATLVHRTDE